MKSKSVLSLFPFVFLPTGCVQEDDFAVGGGGHWSPAPDQPYDESASKGEEEEDQRPEDDDEPLLRGGTVYTLNSNGDNTLSPGELTTPGPEFHHKDTCSQGITLVWRACLMEEGDNGELGGSTMCAYFETELLCDNDRLRQGDTECTGNEYCEILIPDLSEASRCGWRIIELIATNADTGEELEAIDTQFIDALGFELLPVEPG